MRVRITKKACISLDIIDNEVVLSHPDFIKPEVIEDFLKRNARSVEKLEKHTKLIPFKGVVLTFVEGSNFVLGETTVTAPTTKDAYKGLLKIFKKEVEAMISHHCQLMGTSVRVIKFSDTKTKWGSMSGSGEIQISHKLMMHGVESWNLTVVHELCHRFHFNHKPEFYRMLEIFVPNHLEIGLKRDNFTQVYNQMCR